MGHFLFKIKIDLQVSSYLSISVTIFLSTNIVIQVLHELNHHDPENVWNYMVGLTVVWSCTLLSIGFLYAGECGHDTSTKSSAELLSLK